MYKKESIKFNKMQEVYIYVLQIYHNKYDKDDNIYHNDFEYLLTNTILDDYIQLEISKIVKKRES